MTQIVFDVREEAVGGYVAQAIGESIVTQAETLEELRAMVQDAVACHFEDDQKPSIIRLIFTREEVLSA